MLTNSLPYYFFLVYLARSKRPNTPHFVFKRIVRNFEVRAMMSEGLIVSIRFRYLHMNAVLTSNAV